MYRLLFIQALIFSIFIDCSGTPETTGVVAEQPGTAVNTDLLTLPGKVKHLEALTKVVKTLSGGLGLGNNCLAHHLYLMGPMGVTTKAAGGDATHTFKAGAVKAANYTEPVIAGLVAVAKADVYVLKQIVETSEEVFTLITAIEVDITKLEPAAEVKDAKVDTKVIVLTEDQKGEIKKAKAAITTTKTELATAIQDNVQNAMSTLAPVEEVIYGYAVGADTTSGGMKTGEAHVAAIAKLGSNLAILAVDTSSMIEKYFALLASKYKTTTALTATNLTKMLKAVPGSAKTSFGETTNLGGGEFFTPADAYQKAFVAFVKEVVKDKTIMATGAAADFNAVAGLTIASSETTKHGDSNATNKTEIKNKAIALDGVRKTYVTAIGETLVDISATQANDSICGRKATTGLVEITLGLFKST